MALNDGTYRAKAKSWVLAESSKGTPEVAVEFAFTAPDLIGKVITWDGWLSDTAADRTIESLRHCGWQGENLEDLTGLDTNEVDLVIENEEYEGKWYPKVQWVNRPGGIARTLMAPEKVKTFASLMRDRIRAVDAAGGRKTGAGAKPKTNGQQVPASLRAPEPPPIGDDDMLF